MKIANKMSVRYSMQIVFGFCMLCAQTANSQGLLPVPNMDDVELQTAVTVGTNALGSPIFTYDYTLRNGATNEGLIWMFSVDVSTAIPGVERGETYPVRGGTETKLWSDDVAMLTPFQGLNGNTVLRVTQVMPLGWNGGATRDGFAVFSAGSDATLIGPGDSLGGFLMTSNQPPIIRDAVVIPQWFLLVDDLGDVIPGVTDSAAFQIEDNLRSELSTLGPAYSGKSAFAFSRNLRRDIPRAVELGWITDAALSTLLIDALDNGIAALQAQDGDLAKTFFQAMLDTIVAADPSGFRNEFRSLVELNAIEIIRLTPPTPIPFEPEFSFETNADVLPVGETFTLTARYVNAANNDEPIPGFTFRINCIADFFVGCPNFGFRTVTRTTDINGEAVYTLVGLKPGVDLLGLGGNLEEPSNLGRPRIEWTGGPDLVVPEFIPPTIEAETGETIFITDSTMNQGSLPSTESITRYYISDDDPINIATAVVIGERFVPALEPGEVNGSVEIPYTIPNNFTMGLHTMAACADAGSTVIEIDEDNNCSFSELDTIRVFSVPTVSSGIASVFSVGDAIVVEGNTGIISLDFPISIDLADPSEDVSVSYATVDGSATTADGDYEANSGIVTFVAGTSEFTQIVSVPVNGDTKIESDEVISLVLSNPIGSSDIDDGTGVGTILNDDKATVQIFGTSGPEGDLGASFLSFNVAIDQSDPALPITVLATTQAGTADEGVDYDAVSEVITFSPGTTDLVASLQVPVNGDTTIETDEIFSVILSTPSDNAVLGTSEAIGTVINDDVAAVSVGDVSVVEGDAGTVQADFVISLNQANPFEAVTIDVATQSDTALAGADFTAITETITFSPGTTTATVFVGVLGDTSVELDETFTLVLSNASANATIADAIGLGTILNDDDVSVLITDATTVEGDDTNSSLLFVVSIDQSHPQNAITINYQTQDGTATLADTDYEPLTGSLTFPAGTAVLSQSVAVMVVADFNVELDEVIAMTIGTSAVDVTILDSSGTGNIINDDLSSIQISDVVNPEGDSGTTPFTFEVSIDQPHPTETISVTATSQDGSALSSEDYQSIVNVLNFPAGTQELVQTVVVPVNGDTDLELDETFAVFLSGESANATLIDFQGDGLIVNDDSATTLNCDNAAGTPNTLWPPNHKLVDITISGVLDENNQEASIIVSSIHQDEVLNGEGDGNTDIDGFGVGTDTAQVRRERSGLDDGRIYFIGFDATSSSGATCSGEISIGVPHDQGQGSTPIDSGLRIDSTGA